MRSLLTPVIAKFQLHAFAKQAVAGEILGHIQHDIKVHRTICTGESVALWGLVKAYTAAAAKNFAGLLTARIFLGIFEAIILPSFSLVVGKAVFDTHSALKAYQGVLSFLGSLSLAFVPLIWWMLSNSPATARFLRKGNDRLIAIERARENDPVPRSASLHARRMT
jgi:hypothetical protein